MPSARSRVSRGAKRRISAKTKTQPAWGMPHAVLYRPGEPMGLFDFLGKKNDKPPKASEREIQRLERLLANKLSQNFDRQEAIQELGRMGTAAAASALLKRFD